MNIEQCTINHLTNPLGYQLREPTFAWKVVDSQGQRQISARIIVSQHDDLNDPIVDTDWSNELDSLGTTCLSEAVLKPRTRYYWTVGVRTDAGEETTSGLNWFETGKLGEPWSAQWITADCGERLPVLSTTIDLKDNKRVESARLYISGLGMYEACIDDMKIGDELFAPGYTDYDQWVQYQTYDVTDMVVSGSILGVMLADGWYASRMGFESRAGDPGIYGQERKLIAELHVVYEDGSETVIGTDDKHWTAKASTITFSGIYDGEHRDDTLIDGAVVSCSVTDAPSGRLEARLSPPVTVHERFSARIVHQIDDVTVLDLGQNFSGIFRLSVNEPKGREVHLQFGEVLQNGDFYRDNLRTALAEYRYISEGRPAVIEPKFTFYGYRYVRITGVENLQEEDFMGYAVYSRLGIRGRLTTGSDLVNRLIANVRWGFKSNAVDTPTDCPQRDERLGWTGDAQVFCPTACYLEDGYAFYGKYLHDMAAEQSNNNGMVPEYIPALRHTTTAAVWGDAATFIPWTLYRFFGDTSILATQYESMKAWVEWVRRTDESGNGRMWGKRFQYGDWLALDKRHRTEEETMGGTDAGYVAYVYYMASADILARTAELLKHEKDAVEYRNLSDRVREWIEYEYFTPSGRCCCETQCALLLALKYHLSADETWTRERLRTLFRDNDDKLETGFVGTSILNPTLSDSGLSGLAYTLLLNEEYPGWLREIKLGATTIWERWNSIRDDGSISGTQMNSLNHYSYGAIAEWIFAYAAGIRQVESADGAGFRHALIAPEVNWKIRHIEASYDSAAGEYRVAWRCLDTNHIEIEITVPFGCQADIRLPLAASDAFTDDRNPLFGNVVDGICHVGPGAYHARYRTSQALVATYSSAMPIGQLLSYEPTRRAIQSVLPMSESTKVPSIVQGVPLADMLRAHGEMMGLGNPDSVNAVIDSLDQALAGVAE
ncbi:alpha-L-rhamnosidase [Bifidobacterium sp. SO4]|uniref:alpha-L-rhamnosidase n=1 Tax=Bifidobacterium sp. SO4 TaxID=2809030 RepID=UPI001BDC7023|nr:alpha-L-rhamnosidase [Bifidobacterium sp. SO4]MBT1170604.1 family 78 glycoside hydrolase catalytic domain [Bifidobacterium sp. SO4]